MDEYERDVRRIREAVGPDAGTPLPPYELISSASTVPVVPEMSVTHVAAERAVLALFDKLAWGDGTDAITIAVPRHEWLALCQVAVDLARAAEPSGEGEA